MMPVLGCDDATETKFRAAHAAGLEAPRRGHLAVIRRPGLGDPRVVERGQDSPVTTAYEVQGWPAGAALVPSVIARPN